MSLIQLHSGQYIDLLNPRPEDIFIEDIAHALSNICRFTGHTKQFYSVAQHSVHTTLLLKDQEFALQALLHDASEAYLSDVSTPLKRLLPEYVKLEKRFEAVIAERFDMPVVKHSLVKKADLLALVTEKRDLMSKTDVCDQLWGDLSKIKPDMEKVHPLSPELACNDFLRHYKRILAKQGVQVGNFAKVSMAA